MLADLFVDISKNEVGVLIETHSEHLLLRLRRLVANNSIDANNIALYYIEADNSTTNIKKIPISNDGHIESKYWPPGFFEDSLNESLALASAQMNRD